MRNVLAAAAAFLALAAPASAISSFGSLTGDAFYGDGNPNADFTIERQRALEIALKAKTRFGLGAPADASLGLYVFDRAGRTLDSLAFWNFDWSVNVDRNDATPNDLTTFTYLFSLDRDPSPGTDFVQFDFITAPQVPPFPVGSSGIIRSATTRPTRTRTTSRRTETNTCRFWGPAPRCSSPGTMASGS